MPSAPVPFLSPQWIEAVKEIRRAHVAAAPVTVEVRMNQVVTDVPPAVADTSTVMTYVDTSSGKLVMDLGQLPDADVTVTTDYETARQLFVEQDQAAAMQAFLSGRIRVQGELMKLMAFQAAPPDETAKTIAAEIKAITA